MCFIAVMFGSLMGSFGWRTHQPSLNFLQTVLRSETLPTLNPFFSLSFIGVRPESQFADSPTFPCSLPFYLSQIVPLKNILHVVMNCVLPKIHMLKP